MGAPEERKRELKARYGFRLDGEDTDPVARNGTPGSVDARR
jgi:hypothetical protein